MVHAGEKLYLQVEVVGCPTIWRHCWAQGIGYQAMRTDDVALVLKEFTASSVRYLWLDRAQRARRT